MDKIKELEADIEALEAQLAKATEVVEASGRKRGELEAKISTWDRILRESVPEEHKDCTSPVGSVQSYIVELEAKLAQAVELALEECPFVDGSGNYHDWWHKRRATIAAIKGEE
jgi:chromosome segregation ATPase